MNLRNGIFACGFDRKYWIIGGGVLLSCGLVYGLCKTRRAGSKLCNLTKANINSRIRHEFNTDFRLSVSADKPASHSHPKSAKNRTDCERSIDNWIMLHGYEPYSVSTSNRDNQGQRLYYSAKDLDLPYQNDAITSNHIIRMIDVDYYADMHYWLWKGRPIVIYTFAPDSVGGATTEGTFYVADNVVSVTYNGGGMYSHQLWDYNTDHFIVKGKVWSLMVKVDQIKLPEDSDRRIVLLTPTTWYLSVFNGLLSTRELLRRKLSYGQANVSLYNHADDKGTKLMVSLAAAACPSSVNIKYSSFLGMCLRLSSNKYPNLSDVEKYLYADGITDAPMLAPIIYEAWANGWHNIRQTDVSKIVDCGTASLQHFQARGPLLLEDGKEIGVEIWKPIVRGGAIFPCESFNNDVQAIKGRVDGVKNNVKPPGIFYTYMREFLEYFPVGKLHPTTINYVMEKQTRPLQRVRNENHRSWIGHQIFRVRAFMKKETYGRATDPRNISTCPPSHTINLSTYTYAAKEEFKKLAWFMPCKTPKEIADQLHHFVGDVDYVLSCDYSRLDGTISPFLRDLERAIYLRMFEPRYRQILADMLKDEINCKAVTSTGTRYNPGASRLSGSPLTTDGNTMLVGFVAYCAARTANLVQKGRVDLIPALIYGDDQIVKQIPEAMMMKTAKSLGLTLKIVPSERSTPVEFLARVFVDPWYSLTSLQSPKRTLGKVHVSCIKNVDSRIVARNKADGYMVSDALTPLLSEYCQNVITKTGDITALHLANPQLLRDTSWWLQQFGVNESWPQDAIDVAGMQSVVAKDLGISVSELLEKIEQVKADSWTPIQLELEVTIPVVITGGGDTALVAPRRRIST